MEWKELRALSLQIFFGLALQTSLVAAWMAVPKHCSRSPNLHHMHDVFDYQYLHRQTVARCVFSGRIELHAGRKSSEESSAKRDPATEQQSEWQNQELSSLLQKFSLDRRLQSLSVHDLPTVAEVFLNGKSHLCEILALRPTRVPTLEVKILDANNQTTDAKKATEIVDIGQITTIWNGHYQTDESVEVPFWEHVPDQLNLWPVGAIEEKMDALYQSHVGRSASTSSSSKKAPTKKQITELCSTISNETTRQQAEQVLRQVIKVGTRIVDSQAAAAHWNSPEHVNNTEQAVAAQLLAQDSESGGRFKRMSSTLVDRKLTSDGEVEAISIINGGWLVVDKSVRAGSEARKFAERVESTPNGDDKGHTQQQQSTTSWTVSDDRIAQRLECLAMGQVFSQSENDVSEYGQSLELDVREALKALNTPVTPEGARDVLVRIGRWSGGQTSGAAQPWSPNILKAARWYSNYCGKMKASKNVALQNDRSDLTNIPFMCIDAKSTSFRDDAIGLRPRSVTGRKVSDASKWEILISIADVSDVYSEAAVVDKAAYSHFQVLRDAAASRGASRYDLPLGPLHLMPPVALKGLSFETVNIGDVSNGFNRCITVWAYIDENTGKLLDAGVERSVICQPVALSYASATGLLEGKIDTTGDKELGKMKQLLAVIERNLNVWGQLRRKSDSAAQKREERLALKEYVADQQTQPNKKQLRDDGQDGFRRTRGNKIVDTSLDLYSYVLAGLIKRKKAYIPQQAGSEQGRGGRVATAPLRRYIDGMAQRQVLSVLCNYGDLPMTKAECIRVSREATDAYNSISNIRSAKKAKDGLQSTRASGQKGAVQKLKLHLSGDTGRIIPAVSTGKGNEVVIKGVGAIAKVKGMKQPLKPGIEVLVRVLKLDAETGNLSVNLVNK